jgi:hypothetical protein
MQQVIAVLKGFGMQASLAQRFFQYPADGSIVIQNPDRIVRVHKSVPFAAVGLRPKIVEFQKYVFCVAVKSQPVLWVESP